MHRNVTSVSFDRLADDLKRPFVPQTIQRHQSHPLPETDMIARYGMRRLTPAEKKIFPGLDWVIGMQKARITKPPAVMPKAKGWVVWTVETYPGSYLVKLPGGATLLAPYNEMSWTAVSNDEPATTIDSIKESQRQQHWQGAFKRNIQQYLVACPI